MGDPLNLRASGVTISQPDLPHWCVHILQWLAMVSALQQASGSFSSYSETLETHLNSGQPYPYDNEQTGKRTWLSGPSVVYGIYQSYAAAIKRESRKT